MAADMGLNVAQGQAFATCLGRVLTLPSSLSCVQGPPSTGKNAFFARLALTLVTQAVAAQTQKLQSKETPRRRERRRRRWRRWG